MGYPNQPLVSSHSRSRQVQHPLHKLFLINIISWQYVREVTRHFMGFTPRDRTFSHHGPRDLVTLDRILHNPLCLPIRDRDKYNTHNKHITDKHTLLTVCVRSGTPFDGIHAPQSLRFALVVNAGADPI
jgi:hypothetical protein